MTVVSSDPSVRTSTAEVYRKIRIKSSRAECVTCGKAFDTHFQYRSCYSCNTSRRGSAADRAASMLETAAAFRGIAARKAEIKAEAAARAAREKAKLRKEGR